MELVGGLLVLLSLAALALGFFALFRPIRRLGLGSRKRAAIAMASSVAAFFVGAAMLPPAPTVEAAPEAAAAQEVTKPTEATVPKLQPSGIGVTRAQLLDRVNSEWSDMGRAGAFARNSEAEIDDGPWRGGRSYTDCSSRNVCLMTVAQPSGALVSATSMAAGDGSRASGTDALAAHIALVRTFAPDDKTQQATNVVLDGMERAVAAPNTPYAQEAFGYCVSSLVNDDLGMTVFEVQPLPCSRQS